MRRLVFLLLLAGCPEPEETPDTDSGVTTILFEAEALEGPAILFGEGALSEKKLEVDLKAQQLSRLYGIAYRIEFDPEVLTYERLDRSTAFIHDALFEVKEARPGLLVVAMSAVGPFRGIDLDGVAIARVGFVRKSPALTELRLVRPFGLDENGAEIALRAGEGAIVER